jgi:hypothetical protein
MAGVYVEGDGQRGSAAYLNLPAYWLDHGELRTMIRSILESFGEYPGE